MPFEPVLRRKLAPLVALVLVISVVLQSPSLAYYEPEATSDGQTSRAPIPVDTVTLDLLSSYQGSGSEISAYDPDTKRLFVTVADPGLLDILDVSDPISPTLFTSVDLVDTLGGSPNSVASRNGTVVVALEDAANPQANGMAAFFQPDGTFVVSYTVGAMPDMITFTPDGRRVLTANEGEPSATVDPDGSVSIIDISNGVRNATVATASFVPFNGKEDAYRDKGVRLFPDKTLAQDVEPEYISFSADGSFAFVTLQEANAFGVIDVAEARVKDILPLGLKNHELSFPTLQQYTFGEMPPIGYTPGGQTIKLGGFSGLRFEGMDPQTGNYKFITLPDRGPNGEPTDVDGDGVDERPFALPDFQEKLVRFELDPGSGELAVTQIISLTRDTRIEGIVPITGRPNVPELDEEPVDLYGHPLIYDDFGADMEGVEVAADGTFWTSDEYRPAIYHFDENGLLLQRYIPEGTAAIAGRPAGSFGSETLPPEYALRRANRGFEGLALDTDSNILYAIIQSPLANPNQATSTSSVVIRMLGIDPTSGEPVAQYLYFLEDPKYRADKVDKIGDLVYAGNGQFYAIERDASAQSYGKKYVFKVDLLGATNTLTYTPGLPEVDPPTAADAYMGSLSGEYATIPVLTVGDEVPLLEGTFPSFTASASQTFAMPGIPDGLGIYETDDAYFVFVNHELQASDVTPLAGASGQIKGARVSLYKFTKDWQVVGGRNLIDTVEAGGRTYVLDTTTGNYVAADNSMLNFARFCSAYLASSGFVDEGGSPAPIWFAPEENDSSSRGWAVYPNGKAVSLDHLGRYAKEQVLAASQYRADNSNTTVLFSTEDNADGEVYMYVGQQTAADPNGFAAGQLYVLRVADAQGNVYSYETIPEGTVVTATWTLVPEALALGSGQNLSNWVNADQRSTNFRRPEDIHEDPNHPGTFYFVTTGRNDVPPGGTAPDNAYGKLYRFTLNPTDPTAPMQLELALTGGSETGVSYDNIVVDHHGRVLIQEDRTAGGEAVMEEQRRYAQVWAYDIATDSAHALLEANQAEIDPSSAGDYGNWESSGIVEVETDAFMGRSSYLMDVQAHSLIDPSYVEGGQILLVVPTATLEQLTPDQLANMGIQPVNKVKIANLPSLGYLAGDKTEGLALLPDGSLAVINDNDFGVAPLPITGNGTVPLNPNPTPTVLGIVSFGDDNALDPSDRDGGIHINNWPVLGMYAPDGVASFTSRGLTYYVTANEGDTRSENVRIKNFSLNPAYFPDQTTLKQDANLGRLDASSINGDLNGDGLYEQLWSYGARSLSIWDQYGNLVNDSADDFEQITAALTPDVFNSDGTPATFDTRSDNKGPEPEGAVTAALGGRTYAFVGLERTGGIMVYDVSNPAQPGFVSYTPLEDGNLAPEGLLVIPAGDSPNGKPLLVASYEVSGSTGIFQINVDYKLALPLAPIR